MFTATVRALVGLTVLVTLSSIVLAQETQPAQTESPFVPKVWSLTSAFRSQYVFQNGYVTSDKPVIQSDLFIGTPSGLWLDIWSSVPTSFSRVGEDYATEEYVTLGWTGKLHGFKLSFSVAYDELYPNMRIDGTDFIILAAEVSRPIEVTSTFHLEPFIRSEMNFTLNGGVRGTTLPRFGSRYIWQITSVVSLSGKGQVLYDPGMLGADEAFIGSIESSLNWKIGKHVSLEFPFVRGVMPLTNVNDGRRPQLICGAGFSVNF